MAQRSICNNTVQIIRQFLASVEPGRGSGRAYSLGKVARAGCEFCLVRQSATVIAVQETRSVPSA